MLQKSQSIKMLMYIDNTVYILHYIMSTRDSELYVDLNIN
jgi:hypothetical protein